MVLRQWSRPAAPLSSPRIETVDGTTPLATAALLLMALEMLDAAHEDG
jgi:hypothetical protein